MSGVKRMSLLTGVLISTLLLFIVLLGATQEAETQAASTADDTAERPSFPVPDDGEYAPGQIIVELEEEATQADLAAINERNDASTEENLPRSDVNVVDLPDDLSVSEAVRRYEASPDVDYAEPDFLLQPAQTVSPSDPYYPRLYGLNNTGQSGGTPDPGVPPQGASPP